MEKLKELISLCKGAVYIYININRDSYNTVAEELIYLKCTGVVIDSDIEKEMITRDSLIEVQAYPHTPIGSYSVFHYDIEKAIEESLRILKEEHLKNH